MRRHTHTFKLQGKKKEIIDLERKIYPSSLVCNRQESARSYSMYTCTHAAKREREKERERERGG